MTNEEKLDFLLDYLKISTSEIADRFETSRSVISQWRSNTYKKFKKLHQYALKDAFDIPLEVFNESVTTKEQIVSILNKNSSFINSNIDYKILKKLIGDRYCYSYSASGVLEINIVRFLDDLTVLCYTNENLQFYGKIIFLDKAQVVISLSSSEYPYNIFLIFDSEYIINDIFYAIVIFKSDYSKEDIVEFVIMSKNKLPLKDVKKLIQNPKTKQLIATNEFIKNIKHYSMHRSFFNSDILDFLNGSWHLYFKNTSLKEHILIIKDNYKAFWYTHNELSSKATINVDKSNTLLTFKSSIGDKSYFIFDNQKTDIKVLAFKSYLYSTKEEIVGIGIMSKNKLSKEMLDKIFSFNDKFHFNINRFKSFLEDIKESNKLLA